MLNFLPPGSHDVELTHSALSSGAAITVGFPKDDSSVGVVLIPDIHGLRPLVDETVTQLAANGIVTIAVDLFAHLENGSEMTREEKFGHIQEMDDTIQCADILAAGQILRTQHNCARVSLIGFCIGGLYAFKCAGTGEFDEVISCYGMISLPDDWKGPGQREPMEYLAMDTASPTLAIVGGQDSGATAENLTKLKNVIGNAHHTSVGSEVVVYPDAGHGFMHDQDREEHRPMDAANAWKRVLEVITRS